MLAHEQKAHFQAKCRERAAKFAGSVRHDLERAISALNGTCETEEERRDIQKLWSLMNAICAKHSRKAERYR
jgi:hypothetical protein